MSIIERTKFDEAEFKNDFLNKRTVIYRSHIQSWPAIKKWDHEYFSNRIPEIPIVAKSFLDNQVKVEHMSMKKYVDLVDKIKNNKGATETVPYCHDIPIFLLAEKLLDDIGTFPSQILPSWYGDDWSRYVQFFLSTQGNVTPLHYDTLMTSNIFFQIKGAKRFTIIPAKDIRNCYRKNWRWFEVNPEAPNYSTHPKYKLAEVNMVDVEAGDMLYMPPATLHHVRSLEDCISFNIDFHTIKSAINSFIAVKDGIPLKNIYYNYLSLMALINRNKGDSLFNRYKTYLNYVT